MLGNLKPSIVVLVFLCFPILHKSANSIFIFSGNFKKAGEILERLEKFTPSLIQVSYRRINLARRSGDYEKVSELYEHYIEKAKNKIIGNNLTIKYARFCWKVTIFIVFTVRFSFV